MDFIEEVKYWVEKAREADPQCKVSGSGKHGYRFEKPISLAEVRTFEELHHLKLPENYVRVLTELGNGGAGPYYGLYSLYEIEFDESVQIGSDVTFLDASLTPEIWKQAVRELWEAKDDEEYDELMRKIEANAVWIGTEPGDYDTLLMCAGSENGKIISIDLSMDEYDPPRFTHMTFEEWYLSYFQEVAANHRIIRHGYTRLDTEEELIEAYEKAADMEPEERKNERREILSSLWRFQQLSADTINRLRRNPDESIIDLLIRLIFMSDQEAGLAMFDEWFRGEHPEMAILMCRSIPDEIKERYYQRALEILYTPEISERLIPAIGVNGGEPCAKKLLYFLDDCKCKNAKDLIPYAKSDINPDDCRGTAVFVICRCPDAAQYQTEIAELMHCSVYWVAFNAMQGAIRAELREPVIIDALRWMKEYYKDDKYIPSNLRGVQGL